MGRVLLIDDEQLICEIFATVLAMEGRFSTSAGSSGEQLCALLDAHDDVVAVLCDQTLSGETGIAIHATIEPTLRARRIAFILVHGGGPEFRETLPDGYFADHRIAEVFKPMSHIMDIIRIVEAEITKARV